MNANTLLCAFETFSISEYVLVVSAILFASLASAFLDDKSSISYLMFHVSSQYFLASSSGLNCKSSLLLL